MQSLGEFKVLLPLPCGKKQEDREYTFTTTFIAMENIQPGCMEVIKVRGGKDEYQCDLEMTEGGELIWRCSCPDHVYRHEKIENHECKHLRAIREWRTPKSEIPF